jgi:LysM repeat protein
MKWRLLLLLALFIQSVGVAWSQQRLKVYEEYIEKYAPIAIDQQKKYGVPASISLAQGLIESGAGKSELARISNNHFGIKCHNNWKGETVSYWDDGENACFRKYKNVEESYEDHSRFLTGAARYRFLFDLDVTDYKGWAKGLLQAGYATDRQYADKLIRVIETYDLNSYTKEKVFKEKKTPFFKKWFGPKKPKVAKPVVSAQPVTPFDSIHTLVKPQDYQAMLQADTGLMIQPLSTHVVEYIGTTPCIRVKFGDSFASIAEEFQVSESRLRKFNDVDNSYQLTPGERLFLDSKTSWWEGENPVHIVQPGETLHLIAQRYALKLSALCKMNDLKPDTPLKPGQRIKLRDPERMSAFMRALHQAAGAADSTLKP